MKRKASKTIFGVLLILLLPCLALAASVGTVTTPVYTELGYPQPTAYVLTITWAATGSGTNPAANTYLLRQLPDSQIRNLIGTYLVSGEPTNGATAPTAGTTVTFKNSNGTTLLTLTNNSPGNFSNLIPITDDVSITVSVNSTASASQTINLYFTK